MSQATNTMDVAVEQSTDLEMGGIQQAEWTVEEIEGLTRVTIESDGTCMSILLDDEEGEELLAQLATTIV